VRRVAHGDVTTVPALHARLSGSDRYRRFFRLGVAGPTELAASLSDTPGIGHPVVGCFVHNRLVGVARYEVLTDPAEAEIALVWTSARGRLA